MGRRQGKHGARGPDMKNADPVRSRSARTPSLSDVTSELTDEVPDTVFTSRARANKFNARRQLMRDAMEKKAGVTGVGCSVGSLGTVVYALGEQEEALLQSMGPGPQDDLDGSVVIAVGNPQTVPTDGQNFFEYVLEFIRDLSKTQIGEESGPWVPFIGTMFLFIFVSNWSGALLPWKIIEYVNSEHYIIFTQHFLYAVDFILGYFMVNVLIQ